ncbi:MAG: AAA family ATPase, partial [Pseudomonadota bacterium]
MSQMSDQMELREEEILAHYAAALALLDGFDHAPRVAKARVTAAEVSHGVAASRRRFRSTTPGLSAARTVRAADVDLRERIETGELLSPLQ